MWILWINLKTVNNFENNITFCNNYIFIVFIYILLGP